MPMIKETDFGTEKSGVHSEEYCIYCYKDGAFSEDLTMEDMINHCIEFLDEFNKHAKEKVTKEQALAQMHEHFPTLKRWAQQ